MALPLIDAVLDIIKGPVDKLIPDKDAKQKFRHEIEKQILGSDLKQMEVNKAEANHPSIFVAGWRPFIGWICGLALAWHFIFYDFLNWLRIAFFADAPAPPPLNGTETLITVLMSLLGLGGMRTLEKMRGVQRDSWRKDR